ncbi:MAG: N-acetylglucosamine-6-phosphate deacetylase [Mycobacteriales bacterium]
MSIISAPLLLVDGVLRGPAAVVIADGRIGEVLDGIPPAAGDHLQLSEGILSPGLVDLQINGAYGIDFISATPEGWATIAETLPSTGVTAFQPTFTTAPLDALVAGLDRAVVACAELEGSGFARMIGVHLEGPFLSPLQPGVHPVHQMIEPSTANLDVILAGEEARRIITMVTLAPELPGSIDAIQRLVAARIRVSIGHTDATAAQVRAATDAGATMVTHIFNAQRRLGHREPGVPGQALSDKRLAIGLIADLMHVAGEIVGVVMQAAAGRVVLVTDAMAAAGMPAGRYELGDSMIDVLSDGLPRNAAGAIAGSTLALDSAVRNVVGVGVDPAAALEAATRVPADVMGRNDLGRIAPGARADLVWWSNDLQPLRVWIGGQETTQAPRPAEARELASDEVSA